MCECNSNFINQHKTAVVYSNFTDSELRAQCAAENGLNVNDPANQYIINACVTQKKGGNVNEKGQQVVGWIQTGGNILTNIANILGGGFNQQQPPADYLPDTETKPVNAGKILLFVLGGIAVIGVGYMAFKHFNKGGK